MLSILPYLGAGVLALGLSYLLTPTVKNLAFKFGFVDRPNKRKVHQKPIPRLGGVAIFLSFLIIVLLYFWFKRDLFTFGPLSKLEPAGPFWGMILGGVILVIAGILDDIYNLNPGRKLIFQMMAAGLAVGFGVGVEFIRWPFGGILSLTGCQLKFSLFSHDFLIVPWADLISFFWLVLVINVINWLDGLDGLAAGVSSIAAISLLILSLLIGVQQPLTALIAAILAGSILGFLPFNFNPASIFMGDSGSQFLGYMLGVLAIICGGKLATAGLVLGFPILDGIWVISRRVLSGHSPFLADKKHLHHRLLLFGLSQRQAVLTLYLVSICFGLIAILTGTYLKFWAGVILVLLMVIGGGWLVYQEKLADGRESKNLIE
jgi:UDP-GlcNAc:undecaprenyl-phosphate/decaprenyl-phosphate GlcNAc-1-phosphate transferase